MRELLTLVSAVEQALAASTATRIARRTLAVLEVPEVVREPGRSRPLDDHRSAVSTNARIACLRCSGSQGQAVRQGSGPLGEGVYRTVHDNRGVRASESISASRQQSFAVSRACKSSRCVAVLCHLRRILRRRFRKDRFFSKKCRVVRVSSPLLSTPLATRRQSSPNPLFCRGLEHFPESPPTDAFLSPVATDRHEKSGAGTS